MDLQKYINWLDSSIRFDSSMTKQSLEEIRDVLLEIQKTHKSSPFNEDKLYGEEDKYFAQQRELFTK